MIIEDHDTGDEDFVEHRLRRYDEIKARSGWISHGGIHVSCADCYFSFVNLDTACPRHMTKDEKAEFDRALQKLSWEPHPFFKLIKDRK